MASGMLLLVHTPRQRFVVSNDDVFAIRALTATDEQRPSTVLAELGALFNPADRSVLKRRHGLVVPLRRKEIMLLVDHVDMLGSSMRRHALPPLLQEQLRAPWSIGVFDINSELVIQLDVRAVARSLLASTSKHGTVL